MNSLRWITLIGLLAGAAAAWAAEDTLPSQSSQDEAPAKVGKSKRKTKGKRTGEKEAEGTQAPNRFEADTVIKSRYRHNGEPLEVDPD